MFICIYVNIDILSKWHKTYTMELIKNRNKLKEWNEPHIVWVYMYAYMYIKAIYIT